MRDLKEKSLSRLYAHMLLHDTGTISAFRNEYTHKENQARNKSLLAKLLRKDYRVISVLGAYIQDFGSEKATEVGESTFFVVDYRNSGNLEKDLRALGKEFGQDSILYVPVGAEVAELWGTNKTADFPGWDKVKKYDNLRFGKEAEFMTKAGNRPYYFEAVNPILKEHSIPQGMHGRMGVVTYAKMDWRELIEDN